MLSPIRHLLLLPVLVCAALILSGCGCGQKVQQPSPRPYVGQPSEHYAMLTKLHKQGVGVIETGETLTLILPTDCFFRGTTTEVKSWRKGTMQLIARLVKSYHGAPITISGHTDIVYTRGQQQKNSFYYARAVASYLWNHGIPMQHIRVIPDSAKVNVSTNKNPRGAAENRRVEIFIGLKPYDSIKPMRTESVELATHK